MDVFLVWYRSRICEDVLEVIFSTEELAAAWIAGRGNPSDYVTQHRTVHSVDPNLCGTPNGEACPKCAGVKIN